VFGSVYNYFIWQFYCQKLGRHVRRNNYVCPCHHGMVRPQVEDGGTASNMEGSCEYTE